MSNDDRTTDELALLVADVFELAGALRRHGDRLAGGVGQTQARWQLLSVVSVGSWTVPQAARRLGVSRQAVQRVADDLRAEGLARFVDNPHHRRSPLLEPTGNGRAALSTITDAAREWHAEVARAVKPSELHRTRTTLRRLIEEVGTQ